ncbi:MAG: T9SS type A sorting domain-containing protein [Chlorobi bacterium]|nr:T9SS type A sorting domain-containing protein [Chlorobiota bacterium]
MKKLFTFLAVSCFIASLTGQTMKRQLSLPDNGKSTDPAPMFNIPGHENMHHSFPFGRYQKPTDKLLKSANETKQKLDSTIFAYKDDNSDWILSGKTEYQYNENGKVIVETTYNMETKREAGQWMRTYKAEYTYDLNNMLTERVTSLWDNENNQWKTVWKSEYSYDDNGNLILIISYTWNQENSQWEENWKTEMVYDENGYLILQTGNDWDKDANQWVKDYKTEYSYDNSGNLVLMTDYIWGGNQWQNDYKWETEYNDDNYVTVTIQSFWNGSQWEYDEKTEFAYDDQWNTILETVYYWGNEQWINDDKYESTFEDNGNLATETYYAWSEASGTWEIQNKTDYTYNNDYAFEDLVLPVVEADGDDPWWELYYNHMLLTEIYSYADKAGREWKEMYRSDLYYSEIDLTEIHEITNGGMLIYPNPANNEFGVRSPELKLGATLEVYDINGRKLLEKHIPAGNERVKVNVSNLQSGMYFCRITTEEGIVTKKVMVE